MLSRDLRKKILRAQKDEITEYHIYKKLAAVIKVKEQSEVLFRISQEESGHYEFFKSLTQEDVLPDRLRVFIYVFIGRIFGLHFGLKLMERGEGIAQDVYDKIREVSPQIDEIIKDEKKHEYELIDLIDEERLKYASSVVLGLNDALVELTGALAGFTLAIQNTRLIGVVGLITGIAASMSMAASEYLSTKHEETDKSPLKASIYTGIAYVLTVLLLITPYLVFSNVFLCLGLALSNALLVILVFTFYICIAKGLNFKRRFLEMAGLSLSIAAINFFIGSLIKKAFAADI